MLYVGIDPGASGAYAVLFDDGRAQVDSFIDWLVALTDLEALREGYGKDGMLCVLERVAAYPAKGVKVKKGQGGEEGKDKLRQGQGVVSAFSQGENYGRWQMLLECLSIPYVLASPQSWQKEVLGSRPPKGEGKARVWEAMRRRFPQAELSGPRGGKLTGRSDALGLALYAQKEALPA